MVAATREDWKKCMVRERKQWMESVKRIVEGSGQQILMVVDTRECERRKSAMGIRKRPHGEDI
jgi:hypothetical protein